jgi:hypothetical protein
MRCWGYNYHGQVMLFALVFESTMRLESAVLFMMFFTVAARQWHCS